MRSKDLKAVNHLKTHMQVKRNRKATVTPRKMRFWWGVINRAVFGNDLPLPKFRVGRMRKSWGECWPREDYVWIVINGDITTTDLFMGTLAHEMVHQWQWHKNLRFNHVDEYIRWKEYFKRHYDITL